MPHPGAPPSSALNSPLSRAGGPEVAATAVRKAIAPPLARAPLRRSLAADAHLESGLGDTEAGLQMGVSLICRYLIIINVLELNS